MKSALALVLLGFTSVQALSQTAEDSVGDPVSDIILTETVENLDEFLWIKRPLIVFADSPNDPRFIEQMGYITDRITELEIRDVVVITDTDPSSRSGLRSSLHPRGFMLVTIGKDGTIILRKPFPWDVREITRAIDKMPLRLQEIRDGKGAD